MPIAELLLNNKLRKVNKRTIKSIMRLASNNIYNEWQILNLK